MTPATVAIAGATGVVGSRVLHILQGMSSVGRVVAVGRRPPAAGHPKVEARTLDFGDPGALAAALDGGASVALCALGTTMKRAGSRPAFRAVDHDAVVAFARAALARGASRFVLVSSIGADPRARSFYLRTKGEAEAAVAALGYPQVTILRPSLIDDRGTRADVRAGERLTLPVARLLFAVVGRRRRWAPVPADVVARALVRLAFDDSTERLRIVESEALHTLGAG